MGPLGHSISQCIVDFAHGKRCVIAKVAGDDWERSWPATEMTMLACTDQGEGFNVAQLHRTSIFPTPTPCLIALLLICKILHSLTSTDTFSGLSHGIAAPDSANKLVFNVS